LDLHRENWPSFDINNPNASRQTLCDWINATGSLSGAFDFTTKGLLGSAVNGNYGCLKDSNGAPAGLIGWWAAKAVTFIDNHDTGPSTGGAGGQNMWAFPSAKVMQGYCYILTHPGIPMVYWVHMYDWGLHDAIKTLIQIRKAQGITSTSTVSIQAADSTKYAAIIDNKVAMKIGSGSWSPSGAGWVLSASVPITLFGRNHLPLRPTLLATVIRTVIFM
jgi:alpha-amylase